MQANTSPYATAEQTAAVVREATPDERWLHEQLDRLNQNRDEMGGAGDTPALIELAFELRDKLATMEARKDAAYLERNQVVAALAKCFPSGVGRTAIEGWSEDWHGCVYIDLPTGQTSWHFHDSQAYLFTGLPQYDGEWDGHTTEVKYQRLAALADGRHHLRDKLNLVELAIHEYHAALDQREHGGVAQSRAISHIENCLGIHWQVADGEPRFKPDADLVHQVAKGLLYIADEAEQVVTVERTPRKPLAMGNADYLVTVRPKRGTQ